MTTTSPSATTTGEVRSSGKSASYGVHSEVGRLRKVIVHRPGGALDYESSYGEV